MNPSMTRSLTGSRDHPVLTFRRTYRASPAQLRDACTNTERLRRWFGEVEGEPERVGDHFSALLSEDSTDAARGRVLRCDEDVIAVSWSWQGEPESILTARITPVDEYRTELTLQHALDQPDHAVGYGGGWEEMLHALARSLEATDDEAVSGDEAAPENKAAPEAGAAPDDEAATNERIEAAALAQWRTITNSALEIETFIPASPEQVWQAFTTTEGLQSWWWRHWRDVRIEADVRIGGRYRIEAPSAGIAVGGTYLAVGQPTHLAFTWRWQDEDGTSVDEAVDIRFAAQDGGTRILLRHTGPWTDDAPATSYREGWLAVLGQLAGVLPA